MGYWQMYVYAPWAIILAGVALSYALWFSRQTHRNFFPIAVVSLLSGLYGSVWFSNPYNGKFDILTFILLGKYALVATVTVIFGMFFLSICHRQYTLLARIALWLIGQGSVAFTLYQAWHGQVPGGLSGNPSMNGSLIAALIPFIPLGGYWTLGILPSLVAVYLTHASIPVGVLAVVLLPLFRWQILVGGSVLVGLAHFNLSAVGHPLFDSNGRFEVYRWVYTWWRENASPWFGAGLGSGSQFIQLIQRTHGQYSNLFPWLHSDWLQIGFEMGAVGMGTALLTFGTFVVWARKSRTLISAVLAFGAMMLFNYPLHAPLHAVCMILVAYIVMRERGSNGQESKSKEKEVSDYCSI